MKNNSNVIDVQGARVHNLKNIDVQIPRDKLATKSSDLIFRKIKTPM